MVGIVDFALAEGRQDEHTGQVGMRFAAEPHVER